MTRYRRDWLDTLARRSIGGALGMARTPEGGSGPGDERFSRGTALRLALVGAASLPGGLWKVSPALAQEGDECFTKCLTDHNKELKRRLQSCDDVFQGYRRTPPKSWARIKYLFPILRVPAYDTLAALCYRDAADELRRAKNNCYDGCEATCRTTRSLQTRSSATCEATPPRKAPPPKIPMAPDPQDAPCWACAGLCCGSCPNNPQEVPCVTVLTDGTPAEDCATALARCS